jgi:hypothetical protein
MSSTIENIQKILEARVDAGQDLAIANPFTALFNQQPALVDMGAEQVTIEMWKGNRKVAPLISRLVGSGVDTDVNVIRPGVAGANDYLFALASQPLELPSSVLNKRIPGESMFVKGSEADIKNMRRRFHMMNMAIDATRRILTRNELLANQAYFDSEMSIGDTFQGDTKLIFPRSASLKNRTVAVSWATAASATPWVDYANAQKAIKAESQVDGRNTWLSFLSSTAMENLKAIYRSQRAGDTGPNVEFNDFRFNPEQEVPAGFEFLVTNGMEYNGWIRTSYSNSRVHLFTLPEGYDSVADDSGTTYTDWISGETISIGLFSPDYFKAYYGPGILEPPENNVVERAVGRVGIPALGDLSGLTIGGSGIPASSMIMNIYELGRNQGFGATLEHAPIYAPKRPDVTATIDTLTTA